MNLIVRKSVTGKFRMDRSLGTTLASQTHPRLRTFITQYALGVFLSTSTSTARDNECVTTTFAPCSIDSIETRLASLRERLAAHPLYSNIRTIEHLRIFMESHVFAVWDFMSLLKSLQRSLTCTEVPWTPTPYPTSRRFINEIVLGEESDEFEGRTASHFELYLEAMQQTGADTTAILTVVEAARPTRTERLDCALNAAPPEARQFVQSTFQVIRHGSIAAQAAAFTFGREDAIPAMFRSLVRDLNQTVSGELSQFVWYLERHIEVDGDEHGPLSLRMVADLCGDNLALWEEAAQAAEDAIRARLALWDGILARMQSA